MHPDLPRLWAGSPRLAALIKAHRISQRVRHLGRVHRAQFGAVLLAARLDRITRRAHTPSGLLEEGYAIRAADMPGADDLMMRIYAAMAQKERELISQRTRAALAAAKAHGAVLSGDRGYPPVEGPGATAAAHARRLAAERAAHRLALEVERLRGESITGQAAIARALIERGVPTPRGSGAWTQTTVARVLARFGGIIDPGSRVTA
ncbi:recombinase family protein [Dankookia rubra]|uniref:recombinase family protein n=1 Tax=Dankookia rubra TaxID=1442381 RepID=UPI00240DF8A3|nr:recombinase family protein [Dankookia rubra]